MASTGELQQQQQEHPPQDVDYEAREKRATKKEDLVVLTSGAKEKLDKTIVGMKGAGHIIRHPFNKEAKEEANVRTIEEKDKVGYKQASIRMAAHQQVLQEKAIAAGAQKPEGDATAEPHAVPVNGEKPEEGSPSSSSSDSSSRARAQIPPDSEEYRSG